MGRPCSAFGCAIVGVACAAFFTAGPALAAGPRLAQMATYSASGTHQCKSDKGGSCVVTGSGFTNCNDAAALLRTRDCCPTSGSGGASSGFTLTYCIAQRGLGR